MTEVEQHQYLAQMEEIKRRLSAVRELSLIWERSLANVPMPVVAESIFLQFRKILELIAMASLVANWKAFEEAVPNRKELSKMWSGEKILQRVERINPDFYPKPITETSSSQAGVQSEWMPMNGAFLSRGHFRQLYSLCNEVLHADNPFGRKVDYVNAISEARMWDDRIRRLLNCHEIRLSGYEGLFLLHMHEDRDGQVHLYEFEPVRSAGEDSTVEAG